MKGKIVIFSAPSGSGKTTILRGVMNRIGGLDFSVSATSREPRGAETDGEDYYFMSAEEFRRRIADDAFAEWEEVYKDHYYGTLASELERIWSKGKAALFDVDVKGGINLKNLYGEAALAIFIMPPSVDELQKRLIARGTDSDEKIAMRVAKAEMEISYASQFDLVILNDDLEQAQAICINAIEKFLKNNQV